MIIISRLVNKLMSVFGFFVVRKSTLDTLLSKNEDLISISKVQESCDLLSVQNELHAQSRMIQAMSNKLADLADGFKDANQENLSARIAMKWEIVDCLKSDGIQNDFELICPLCSHQENSSAYQVYQSHCAFGGGVLNRFQCPACDVIFGDQKMLALTQEQLSQEYENHYRIYSEGDSTEQEIRAFKLLNPKKDGVYLNYGAGAWSKSVKQLRDQGWTVFAFEPHDSAESNVEYLIKSRDELIKMRFDGVFTNNVLEHFRYPEKDLSFISSIVLPGGLMAHATPCYEYLYEYTRFHLFFFLGRSREVLASKAKLTIVDFVEDGHFMCAVFKQEDLQI